MWNINQSVPKYLKLSHDDKMGFIVVDHITNVQPNFDDSTGAIRGSRIKTVDGTIVLVDISPEAVLKLLTNNEEA